MNRELKFRVWNGMEMEYNVTTGKFGTFYVNPENNGLDPNDSASLTPNTTKYDDNIPVMQYSGKRDKNGKEIYEGDILHYAGMMDTPYVVSFIDGQFVSCFKDNESPIGNDYQCVVVGNIYEKRT